MRVYKVETDGEIYWVDEESFNYIYEQFGRVDSVIQYDLSNPLDVTAQANGDYFEN